MKVFKLEEGLDVTELLGVQKWEIPIPAQLAGVQRGNFPTLIPKTDQERVQNLINKRDRETGKLLIEGDYEVTLKLDGSSMTVAQLEDIHVCSRNMDLDLNEENAEKNAFVRTAANQNLDVLATNIAKHLGVEVALQGELMGEGIQGNREGLSGLDFYLFDIFNVNTQTYLTPEERTKIVNRFSINHAPVLFNSFTVRLEEDETPRDLLERLLGLADCKSISHPVAEGLVFKSLTDPDKSFKVINNKFLLKEK